MNKDTEPNKYVLDAVKSRELGHSPLGACQGSRDLLFNYGTFP